ncbi:hypothetical protein Taro_017898 [Colocasia esculenta]|uniref:Uncharacterized protein n=1 Tax=Colocasia esculenta TaxID=4460 RepID=A0A843UXF7_COLES|nr:hypothetical protein [Colocasia esculenta]
MYNTVKKYETRGHGGERKWWKGELFSLTRLYKGRRAREVMHAGSRNGSTEHRSRSTRGARELEA